MKYLTLILLFFACASTQPATNPPIVTPPKPEDTVWLPGKVDTLYKHDTVAGAVIRIYDTFYSVLPFDTAISAMIVYPIPGDNLPQLQAASNYCIAHGIPRIKLADGPFHTSGTWLLMNFQSGRFGDFGLTIEGASWAKNPVSGLVTELDPDFTDEPTVIVQQGKDVKLLNIMYSGLDRFADTLTPLQIDTLTFNQWSDGKSRDNPTSPFAAIVFDPFSDSTAFTGKYQMYPRLHQYYVNTGGSGSTACEVKGSFFEDFVVAVLVTGGDNYNGEEIDVDDNQFVYDRVDYAGSQAQSKANTFNNNMPWGQNRDIVDLTHFGFARGDAATAPFIDGMNVAGFNYELIDADTRSFSISIRNVYSEGLFRLGVTGLPNSRGAGVHFEDCQIDFMNDAPSPDFFYRGAGTTFTNCILRYYDGGVGPQRIVINDYGDRIEDGTMSAPPLVVQGQNNAPQTIISNAGMFYSQELGANLSGNAYDSLAGGLTVYLTIDRSTFNGFFTTPDTTDLTPGMLLVAPMVEPIDSASNYHPLTPILNSQTIVGVFDHKNGDTVFMTNMGANVYTGMELPVYKCLYRKR